MENLLHNAVLDLDLISMSLIFGWTLLKKSPFPKKIMMKLKGNESGQIRNVPSHTSVRMPDNANYRFWDAETSMEIHPRRQVIVNKDVFLE